MTRPIAFAAAVVLVFVGIANAEEQTDSGYALYMTVHSFETEKDDGSRSIRVAYRGFNVSENESSPLYNTVMSCDMTNIRDASGARQFEHFTCNALHPDGDEVFLGAVYKESEPHVFKFIGGTGKWEGISGTILNTAEPINWPDDSIQSDWSITWALP